MWEKRFHTVRFSIALVLFLVVMGVALSCAPTPAQWGGFELLGYSLPADNSTSWGVALGDVDGDEDLDVVFANYGQNRLCLNNGAGVFTDATSTNLPTDSDDSFAVALGDVDGDDDLDIVFANRYDQNRLYLNNGAGVFTDVTSANLPADSDDSEGVALGDVDGDGDLDIIFANRGGTEGGQNRLYVNNGAGVFTDATSTSLPVDTDNSIGVVVGDVDGDGDLDIVFANSSYPTGGQNRLYLNSGSGTFTDDTPNLPARIETSTGVALGDVDSDDDPDIIFANYDQNTLYLNSGNATFTNATSNLPADSDDSEDVAVGDVDADGDLDIIFANNGQNGQNTLYLGSGNATFTDAASNLPAVSDYTTGVALGDVDGDDDLDIVLASRFNQNRLYVNNGVGVFTDATSTTFPLDNDLSEDVALGDVDGDEDLDVIFANIGQNRLYLNDGEGVFADATLINLPSDSDASVGVALGDVDNDENLDIVFANGGGWGNEQSRLYLNSGAGVFTDATSTNLPARSDDNTFDVALGDVDGDDDLDIVFANRYQNWLYLNDGAGVFTDATSTSLPVGNDLSLGVALGDLDGDLDLDIIFAVSGRNRLYLNNGAGVFTDASSTNLPVDSDSSEAVALGDVDGDGDLDIIVANFWDEQNTLYINQGDATFTYSAARLPQYSDRSNDVAMGDVDGDEDLDIIFANGGAGESEQNKLYLNNGAGFFTDATSTSLPGFSGTSGGVAMGDIDGDEDLDVIFANEGANRLYTNMGSL